MAPATNLHDLASTPLPKKHGLALVADDEPIVLRLGQMLLGQFGFDVLTATNGKDALETYKARSGDVKVVVLDLTMPALNGVETLQAIRAIDPHVPVIICTGYTDVELPPGAETGYTRFLTKPYFATELRKLVMEGVDSQAALHV